MKLTRASAYALNAVAYMAALEGNSPTASHIIALDRGISEKFLLKVLKPLVSARILASVKGPNGGYRLAKPATDISMLEILEAVEGPIRGEAPNDVDHATNVKLQEICQQVADKTRLYLAKIKMTELCG